MSSFLSPLSNFCSLFLQLKLLTNVLSTDDKEGETEKVPVEKDGEEESKTEKEPKKKVTCFSRASSIRFPDDSYSLQGWVKKDPVEKGLFSCLFALSVDIDVIVSFLCGCMTLYFTFVAKKKEQSKLMKKRKEDKKKIAKEKQEMEALLKKK
jgi:hypothetical protein